MKTVHWVLAAAMIALASPVLAQTAVMQRVDKPLTFMTVATPEAAVAARSDLIQAIWGTPQPTPVEINKVWDGTCCNGQVAPTYFGITPASSVWLSFLMENNIWSRTYFATFPGTTCLAIVNGGHSEGFFNVNNLSGFLIPSVDSLVRSLAGKCDIILNSMPLDGENLFAKNYTTLRTHADLGGLTMTRGTPLRYFLDPAVASLNYALAQRSYAKVIAVGLSGGGWGTTMLAAIDPRIMRAYAVAGSVPLAYRNGIEGDWEQYHVPADYLDLYAMSVAEAGRKSFLFYNGKDSCCFQSGEVTQWAAPLGSALTGFPGTFAIYMMPGAPDHAVQPQFADFILRDVTTP